MASNPVTPQPKQNGNSLQDPFTDENNRVHVKSKDDRGKDRRGDQDRVMHGEDSEEETPSLFYAYARRVCPSRAPFSVQPSPLLHLSLFTIVPFQFSKSLH